MSLMHRKSLKGIQEKAKKTDLKRSLNYIDMMIMGVGVIVGTGIFVLTGIGAAKYAGPGMTLSFVFAGITCGFVALAYAELSSMMPVAGSAYTYTYSIFGEIIAWIVGWALILEYTLAAALLANGWSAYLSIVLKNIGINPPKALFSPIYSGGILDLPAIIILVFIAFLLIRGSKESATVTRYIVIIKLLAIFIFLFLAAPRVNPANWHPFLPFGINGIFTGASFAFLSYLGFDILSNMAEETVKPSRDLPVGIIGSLIIVTLLYVSVTLVLTGVVPYSSLDTAAPVAFALNKIGYRFGSAIVGTGIIFGLTTVILVCIFAQSRLFLAMSRDGLVPKSLCKIHPKFKTPYRTILGTIIIVIIVESVLPINILAELVNMGTITAFLLTSAGTLALRFYRPDLKRPFKCPYPYVVMPLAIICCAYLILKLEEITWIFFIYWSAGGLIFYLLFGYWNSNLHKASNFGKMKDIVKRVKNKD